MLVEIAAALLIIIVVLNAFGAVVRMDRYDAIGRQPTAIPKWWAVLLVFYGGLSVYAMAIHGWLTDPQTWLTLGRMSRAAG